MKKSPDQKGPESDVTNLQRDLSDTVFADASQLTAQSVSRINAPSMRR